MQTFESEYEPQEDGKCPHCGNPTFRQLDGRRRRSIFSSDGIN